MEPYIESAIQHAKEDEDHEVCGLVVIHKGQKVYFRCENTAQDKKNNFIISPESWVRADNWGEIVGIVHSHPDRRPLPSQADLVGCERSGVPWTIVNPRTEEFHVFEPTGYQAPLYGREYCWGTMDCYTFVQDYYKQEYGIILKDYDREENFWEKGQELYLNHFASEGFYPIEFADVKPGDAVIMNIGSDVANHSAIYLGDDLIGHHLWHRLSSRDLYGGYYRKHTRLFVRHKDINQ